MCWSGSMTALPGAVLRVALGYVTAVAWLLLIGLGASGWTVMPFFLAVLAAVRIVPAVIRAPVVSASRSARSGPSDGRWPSATTRTNGRSCSGSGSGSSLHLALSPIAPGALLALAVVCVVAGTLGLATWRTIGAGVNGSGSTGTHAAPSGTGAVAGS